MTSFRHIAANRRNAQRYFAPAGAMFGNQVRGVRTKGRLQNLRGNPRRPVPSLTAKRRCQMAKTRRRSDRNADGPERAVGANRTRLVLAREIARKARRQALRLLGVGGEHLHDVLAR